MLADYSYAKNIKDFNKVIIVDPYSFNYWTHNPPFVSPFVFFNLSLDDFSDDERDFTYISVSFPQEIFTMDFK